MDICFQIALHCEKKKLTCKRFTELSGQELAHFGLLTQYDSSKVDIIQTKSNTGSHSLASLFDSYMIRLYTSLGSLIMS